jgi:hypothetical protein
MSDSVSIVPAAAPAPQKLWALPDRGLAVFHGHPDVPRLFHYFLPRLIAQEKPVLCLDGANRFDPLLIARFSRERHLDVSVFNRRIRVARAFTCFQLTELLVRAPRLLEKFPAAAVVVTALPDLFFDEDIREPQATASFRRALEALAVLRARPVVTAVFTDAPSFQTPRRAFFAQLVAQSDSVSQFIEQEGRLGFASHPPTLAPRETAAAKPPAR